MFATAAGDVAISGNVKSDDYSVVSGDVAIRCSTKGKSLDLWLESVDAEVARILDVVSFADGHFMRPTAREVYRGKKLARIDFLGSSQGSAPHKPPLHWLNFSHTLTARRFASVWRKPRSCFGGLCLLAWASGAGIQHGSEGSKTETSRKGSERSATARREPTLIALAALLVPM